MRLWFKQRFFSWFDSYDIYDEEGNVVYTVEGQLAWGHCLHVLDRERNHIGTLWEDVSAILRRYEMYLGETLAGTIQREATFIRPYYEIDCCGWQVDGDLFGWDYTVKTLYGNVIATISWEMDKMTDAYVVQVEDARDALLVLMMVLALDADKCSRRKIRWPHFFHM